MRRWDSERRPRAKGFVATYMLETQGGDLIGVAVFQDEKSYRDNANDPEQDRWYQEMRKHLEADPEWNDGTYVHSAP